MPLEKELTPEPYESNICMSHLSQDTHTPGETRTCRGVFVRTHTHYAFPFFSRASFQWACAFVNEPKQEPGTDSWVLTPHSVTAEQCSYHTKQKALMSEVKHRAYAAKVS